MKILGNLEPKLVFEYFEAISEIPRGSGNEKGISDYLLNFGKKLGLETIQDEANNIIIKKPASKGYENAPTVIIQGHMDMVCEKNAATEHDFEKDGLKLRIDGDNIFATGTTLGADNGIAVAYAMAILADDTVVHPAIEVLMTTDEETGMSGAMALSPEHIDGKILINLDSEEEGYLLVSCAGGVRSRSELKLEWQNIVDKALLSVKIRGLKGGHSGMDIIKERGNSNKLIGRVLQGLMEEVPFNLVSITGGSKDNAIPREAEAIIAVEKDTLNMVTDVINKWNKTLKEEFRVKDPEVNLTVEAHEGPETKEFTKEITDKVVNLINLYQSGIFSMSADIEGLVESSTNLGVMTTTEDRVVLDSAVRSSVPSLKRRILVETETLAKLFGAEFSTHADYPSWQYSAESKIRETCKEVYKRMNGKEAEVVAIHAGVECGLFNERLGNLDMISFGPNLYDVHTPEERMSISSVQNVYEYLLEVLKEIK